MKMDRQNGEGREMRNSFSFLENKPIIFKILQCVRECVFGKKCVKITHNVCNLTGLLLQAKIPTTATKTM